MVKSDIQANMVHYTFISITLVKTSYLRDCDVSPVCSSTQACFSSSIYTYATFLFQRHSHKQNITPLPDTSSSSFRSSSLTVSSSYGVKKSITTIAFLCTHSILGTYVRTYKSEKSSQHGYHVKSTSNTMAVRGHATVTLLTLATIS